MHRSLYIHDPSHYRKSLQNLMLHTLTGKTNIYQTLDDVFAAPILETTTHLTIHALFITVSQDTGTKEKIEELHNSSCSSGNIRERCCGKNLLGASNFSF